MLKLNNDKKLCEISDWLSHELTDEQVAQVLRWLAEDSHLTLEIKNSKGETL